MIQPDTIKLLRECDAGVKMGITSMDEVLEYVHNEELCRILMVSKEEHKRIKEEIRTILENCQDEGKEPGAMAKGMSWMKTNVKLVLDESDETIADLMTDGCNMGVKSLRRYLNQYEAADEQTKDIARRLIRLEEKLAEDIRPFL